MKTVKFFSNLVLMVLASNFCAAQSARNNLLEEAKKAIAQSNVVYWESYAKNDGSIINCYSDDACLFVSNAPPMCGRASVVKFFTDSYNAGVRKGQFTTTMVYGDAREYVTEEGVGKVWEADGKLFDDFKYLVLWKKTKEGWKMHRDSFSSNLQPKE